MNKKTARKALDRTIRITRVAWVGAVSIPLLAMAEAILVEGSTCCPEWGRRWEVPSLSPLQCLRIVILVSSQDSKQKVGDEDTCATTKE